jgi:hypothetical protein
LQAVEFGVGLVARAGQVEAVAQVGFLSTQDVDQAGGVPVLDLAVVVVAEVGDGVEVGVFAINCGAGGFGVVAVVEGGEVPG